MDLVHQVAANLAIDAGKAEKGIGAILMALRMNLDGDTFKAVKHVLEHLRSAIGTDTLETFLQGAPALR